MTLWLKTIRTPKYKLMAETEAYRQAIDILYTVLNTEMDHSDPL